MTITAAFNSTFNIWKIHATGCRDVEIDRKRIEGEAKDFDTIDALSRFIGCDDWAANEYDPEDVENYNKEVVVGLMSTVEVKPCCHKEFCDGVDRILAIKR